MTLPFGSADFDLDLERGKIGEDLVKELLLKSGKVTVEVKTTAAIKFIPVEYEHNGVPSGIRITTAQYWAFVLKNYDDSIFMIKTDYLKKLCVDHNKKGMTKNNLTKFFQLPINNIFYKENWGGYI